MHVKGTYLPTYLDKKIKKCCLSFCLFQVISETARQILKGFPLADSRRYKQPLRLLLFKKKIGFRNFFFFNKYLLVPREVSDPASFN